MTESIHPAIRPVARACNGPLVSCVIIFLNGETHIVQAIESVRAQSYENWELILVDDGSDDSATQIARDYAAREPHRIRYTDHPGHENRGMSASRNAGIALARGEYIALLDADDIWLPERLERHVAVMETHPEVAMSMSPTLYWSSWNRKNQSRFRPWRSMDLRNDLGVPPGMVLQPPELVIQYLESHGAGVPGICSLLIRRAPLLQIGGFEDSFRTLYEDQAFYFKIFLSFPVIAIDEVLDFYRQHEASACALASASGGDAAARPIFLDWLDRYFQKMGVDDPRIWQALRGEQTRFEEPGTWARQNTANAIVDQWNAETRQFVIWAFRPRNYQRLRRLFGLQEFNVLYTENPAVMERRSRLPDSGQATAKG
ncbi:glycosyltransferase family A protein [Paracoccus sp. MBLB3053]|uniref:Glycosyltransferase family A protein n=1 Tax=Paracoccus aurantius TaxID=3073814 RepID=A0ABU2HZT9_9RHOB|nr:glycosyltransferase family A protein [Paracoccus sp. MBLB3053]MDS9470055.1 glycosyltransferase family A protein [Paracoccus sp. MBLB3053]